MCRNISLKSFAFLVSFLSFLSLAHLSILGRQVTMPHSLFTIPKSLPLSTPDLRLGPIPRKRHTTTIGRGGNGPVGQEDAVLGDVAQGDVVLVGLERQGGAGAGVRVPVEAAEAAGRVGDVGLGHAAQHQTHGVDAPVPVEVGRVLDQARHAVLAYCVGGACAGSHCLKG